MMTVKHHRELPMLPPRRSIIAQFTVAAVFDLLDYRRYRAPLPVHWRDRSRSVKFNRTRPTSVDDAPAPATPATEGRKCPKPFRASWSSTTFLQRMQTELRLFPMVQPIPPLSTF